MQEDLIIVNEILEGINNGVLMPDGGVRDFDIFDYYQMHNENIGTFYHRVKENLSKDERIPLAKLTNKSYDSDYKCYLNYQNTRESATKARIMNTTYIYDAAFDNDGKIIPELCKYITDEQKEEFLAFAEGFDCEITFNLFNEAKKRIKLGISLTNENERSL